nr:hypothetical protein [Tanacetum cinerariifolium]
MVPLKQVKVIIKRDLMLKAVLKLLILLDQLILLLLPMLIIHPLMLDLEDAGTFDDAYDDRYKGAKADYNNLETVILVGPIPSPRIHKDHPKEHIIREVNSAVQTRKMAKHNEAGLISFINKQRRTNHKDFQNFLFACFLSQMEPKKVTQALDDEMDLPPRKRAIGTKWVYRNKRDQRGIVVRNKAKLVAQGHRQEEGIDYDEFFALVARIEAIRMIDPCVRVSTKAVNLLDISGFVILLSLQTEDTCLTRHDESGFTQHDSGWHKPTRVVPPIEAALGSKRRAMAAYGAAKA